MKKSTIQKFKNTLDNSHLFVKRLVYGPAYVHLYILDDALKMLCQYNAISIDQLNNTTGIDDDIRNTFYQLEKDGFANISEFSITPTKSGHIFLANGGYLAQKLLARITTISVITGIVAAIAAVIALFT